MTLAGSPRTIAGRANCFLQPYAVRFMCDRAVCRLTPGFLLVALTLSDQLTWRLYSSRACTIQSYCVIGVVFGSRVCVRVCVRVCAVWVCVRV